MTDDHGAPEIACVYRGHRDDVPSRFTVRGGDPATALRSVAQTGGLRVLFFARRAEFFDFADLCDVDGGPASVVRGFATESDLLACDETFDIAIVANSLMSEHLIHLLIRQRQLARVIVAWTLDNHHQPDLNRSMVAGCDIVLPAHSFSDDVFDSVDKPLGRSFPLATGQWTRKLALDRTHHGVRSGAVYGGYIDWPVGRRSAIVRACIAADPASALRLIDPKERGSYFDADAARRFDEWSGFKTHLALPLARDLSCRLFDSLLCGQVPMAPSDCPDLDLVVPRAIQKWLPIVRFEEDTPDAIRAAAVEAVARFDHDGAAGVDRRRDFALRYHHIAVRLRDIATYLLDLARDGAPSTILIGNLGMRWTLGRRLGDGQG